MLAALGSIAGSVIDGLFGNKQAKQQAKLQKEFAQSGIQWKVEDAKKAGIHPLYALGANTASYTPVSGGDTNFAEAGQNLGRAIQASQSPTGKVEALQVTNAQLQNEGLKLDNDLKRTQLVSAMALANQPGTGPGVPTSTNMPALDGMPGQGNTPQIDGPKIELERKIAPAAPGAPHAEYGNNPDVTFAITDRGTYTPVIPQALAESYEQDWLGGLQWQVRNKWLPQKPPPVPLPKGWEWNYHVPSSQWEMRPILKKGSGQFRRY